MRVVALCLALTLWASAQPLQLEEIRRLDFVAGSLEPFVTAASGVARFRDQTYVVNDDSLYLGQFGQDTDEGGRPILLFKRLELPQEKEFRKTRKPDMESLALVDRCLLSFGSGSASNRETGILVSLSDLGEVEEILEFSLVPLYRELHQRIPDLNIEGLAPQGTTLRLVHRGNSSRGFNAVIDLDLGQVMKAAGKGESISGEALKQVLKVDLGVVEGTKVRWTFTDLAPLDEKRSVFIAAAEDTDNPYEDGEVLGSAVGILDADGSVTTFRRVEQVVKLEGVDVQVRDDGLELLLVNDPDDATQAARAFRAMWPGFYQSNSTGSPQCFMERSAFSSNLTTR